MPTFEVEFTKKAKVRIEAPTEEALLEALNFFDPESVDELHETEWELETRRDVKLTASDPELGLIGDEVVPIDEHGRQLCLWNLQELPDRAARSK